MKKAWVCKGCDAIYWTRPSGCDCDQIHKFKRVYVYYNKPDIDTVFSIIEDIKNRTTLKVGSDKAIKILELSRLLKEYKDEIG